MPGPLRSFLAEPRPPGCPPLTWRDWLLVAVCAAAAVLESVFRPDMPHRVAAVVLAVGLTPMLLIRRSRPLLAVTVTFAVTLIAPVFTGNVPPEEYSLVYLLVLLYALFRWGSGREAALGLAVIVVKQLVSFGVGQVDASDTVGGTALTVAVLALGAAARYRSGARARELDQVRLRERERLARDLHDTVAHHVSAMAIRAQAGLATAGTDPDAAAAALRLIESEAKEALTELRTVVRALRTDEPDAPRLADLSDLAQGAGPRVEIEVGAGLGAVAPPVGAALYRIAQEAITNARRHARGATRITVRVAAEGAQVRLRVDDDGAAHGPPRSGSSTASGYGVSGMRERAELLGGTCTAGPGPDRGWYVEAVLPA
ncbi:two-component sensor histidine kinase [Actinoplanes ianthinogenes]|uniref:histidine kinase n=1 Tax=Actinoplanes ianthinogenes TaxID=122358 RepID=A0ABM7LMJ5_9ACTN|nr:histidine kinase [Actinoplanes ianthinogenes]BCJ40491.1 two-component sensor histidine kinase [Actinoplanes ianthinogenes]GGR50518.1 two-component sensor histidine kinase [Actinoplanes ianthinogenes]